MKLTNVTSLLAKVATTAMLAGAVAIAAPAAANAQVSFGVHVGRVGVYAPAPVYARPYPVYRGYYGPVYPVRPIPYDRWHRGYWR